MKTHADKTQENKSQLISDEGSQVQSGGDSTFQFVDNRPEAAAQRKLQELVNNSPQVKKAAQLQTMANNHTAQQRQPAQRKENNTGLPDNLKTGIENLSGYSMDDVKVHRNSSKPSQLQAHAYAQGTDIHLAPGQEKHLPHEAWHVAQQKQGRVKPTTQVKGNVSVNDDVALEKEADVMGERALQVMSKNKEVTDLDVSQRKENAAAISTVAQRRPLNSVEREKLDDAKKRFADIKERYESHKTLMANALTKRGGFGDTLGYFQNLGWDDATEEITRLDTQFTEMGDLARRAVNNHKPCGDFIAKVNHYDKSGGMNRFYNIYKNMERKLLSTERNDGTQFTEMDEVAFQKYLAASKSPLTVYRGAGWGELDQETFRNVAFADIAAGGTPDISFRGVVEHTWSNTLKNGMVSCTSSQPIALGFATDQHEYGIVWELALDNYIHVTNFLKKRNWKYRFPGQFEVLYPGSIPAANIVSMTLYRGKTEVARRTP
jgi:hypothetical protein